MKQKAITQKQWEQLKKQLNEMSRGEAEKWLYNIYMTGFNDCKKQVSPPDADVYVWDEPQLRKILKECYIADRLVDEIVDKLEQ